MQNAEMVKSCEIVENQVQNTKRFIKMVTHNHVTQTVIKNIGSDQNNRQNAEEVKHATGTQ